MFIQNNKIGSFIRASCRDCLGLFLELERCFLVGLCIWAEVAAEGIVLVGRIAEGRVAVAGRGRAAARIGAGDIVGEGTEGEEGEVVADALG